MTDSIMQFLKEINIAQLIAIGSMFWFFYTRLDRKIEKMSDKIDDADRRLSEKIEDVDRRLCRIEGSLATQGHCLFSQTKSEQKTG